MEYPIYGLTREGIARPDTNIYYRFQDTITTRWLGQKSYELTDQLGNVRATISDIKLPTGTPGSGPYKADFLSYMNPYPFGMPEPGRFWEEKVYRYGYNGKERDDEIKGAGESYDYGFRMLDPRVGRFLSVDPLTAEYPWYTPYQFAGNMPTSMVDRDGLEPARPTGVNTRPTETGGDVSADQGSAEQSLRTVKSDVSRVTPTSMRALAIQQSRESIAPATPVEDDRSFGSGVLTGVLGFFVKTGLTFTTPQGLNQVFNIPVTLAKAGYQVTSHPVQTYDAVSRAFTKFYNSSSYHKGEVFGEVLGLVGLTALTSGGGGAIGAAEGATELAPEIAGLSAEVETATEVVQMSGEMSAASANAPIGPTSVSSNNSIAESGLINPADVRFSQNSIGATFKNGNSVNDIANALRGADGDQLAASFPPIRLVAKDGLLFTLDNRRLAAFAAAGRLVPYRMATEEEVAHDLFKFSTTAQEGWGWFITIRLPRKP